MLCLGGILLYTKNNLLVLLLLLLDFIISVEEELLYLVYLYIWYLLVNTCMNDSLLFVMYLCTCVTCSCSFIVVSLTLITGRSTHSAVNASWRWGTTKVGTVVGSQTMSWGCITYQFLKLRQINVTSCINHNDIA